MEKFIYPAHEPASFLHNTELLRKLWVERVSPEEVDLGQWTCGTRACVGGHLGRSPEFLAIPKARVEDDGYPTIGDSARRVTESELFGGGGLFEAAAYTTPGVGQHAEALTRMDRYIAFLKLEVAK